MMQSLLARAVELLFFLFGALITFLLTPSILGLGRLQKAFILALQSDIAKKALLGLGLVTSFVVLESYQSLNFLIAEEAKLIVTPENFAAALRASSNLCAARQNFYEAVFALGSMLVLYRIAQLWTSRGTIAPGVAPAAVGVTRKSSTGQKKQL